MAAHDRLLLNPDVVRQAIMEDAERNGPIWRMIKGEIERGRIKLPALNDWRRKGRYAPDDEGT